MNKGSRDNSKDIYLEFAERDTRFKYIKQENGGLWAARNTCKGRVCKCQYKNVQKWQNKNVQLFKTNMIF